MRLYTTTTSGERMEALRLYQYDTHPLLYCEGLYINPNMTEYANPIFQFWTAKTPVARSVTLHTVGNALCGEVPIDLLDDGLPIMVAVVLPPSGHRCLKTVYIDQIAVSRREPIPSEVV